MAKFPVRGAARRWLGAVVVTVSAVATAVVAPPPGTAGASVVLTSFRGHGSIDEAYVVGAAAAHPPDPGRRGGRQGRVRGGRPARQPHRPQSDPGVGIPLRRGDGSEPTGHPALLGPVHHRVHAAGVVLLVAAPPRRPQLREDARRDPDRRHRPAATGQDPGRRALPHGDRVLRVRHRRPPQPDRCRRRKGTVERPAAAGHLHRGRRPGGAPARVRRRQRPDAGDGMFGRRLRPPRLPVGLRRLRRRPDRRGPTLGARTTRSVWSGSPTPDSPSSRWRVPIPPTWPPSPR